MARVWKIAPGEHAESWPSCLQNGCILLGWDYLEDYGKYKSKEAVLKDLSGDPGDGEGAALSILRFAHEIKPFDIVVANNGRRSVVGLGIIKSEYLPPASPGNPSDRPWLPHARLVDWVIEQPVDLKPYFFGMSTIHFLSNERVAQITKAYLKKYPKLKATLELLFAGVSGEEVEELTEEELLASAQKTLTNDGEFDPTDRSDARRRTITSIVIRRGQPAFRQKLLSAFGGKCAVTGCRLQAVLEAAHIIPYRGEHTNRPGNGLLLRADIHTLFDLKLMSVDEATMRLLISPELNETEYERYRGRKISIPKNPKHQPSREALEQLRYDSGLG